MQVSILVIGRHTEILEVILRLINGEPNWQAVGALPDDKAIELFEQQRFDIVLIGGGVNDESMSTLTDRFKAKNPLVKIIKHYGGGSGLLFNEILEALN
jgi:DNA-binding NarL/FixJ family response regulator